MDLPSLLPNLHDAVLHSVFVDWKQGRARLELTGRPLGGSEVRLIVLEVAELRLLHCPRAQPWGPSVCVNEARLQSAVDGLVRLELEMQTGDALNIEARSISALDVE